MINTDTNYFFDIVYNFSNVLPLDLRKEKLDIDDKENISKEEIIKILEKYFINENNEQSLSIGKDVERIIESIIRNENDSFIKLLNVSRFSIALKIGTKVLKIGFPKITYKYPNCRIVLDSLIRKQYYINNKSVVFVEVQDLKNCELEKLYSE